MHVGAVSYNLEGYHCLTSWVQLQDLKPKNDGDCHKITAFSARGMITVCACVNIRLQLLQLYKARVCPLQFHIHMHTIQLGRTLMILRPAGWGY